MIVLLIDAVNTNCLALFFRYRAQYEEKHFGIITKGTHRVAQTCYFLEWSLRAAIVCLSLVQSLVINSNKGQYCIEKISVLA